MLHFAFSSNVGKEDHSIDSISIFNVEIQVILLLLEQADSCSHNLHELRLQTVRQPTNC
jgi:hypothetical protein